MGSHLNLTMPGRGRLARTPHRPDGLDVAYSQPFGSSDDHGVVDRFDVEDVSRLAIRGRNSEPKTSPLANREMVIPVVMTDNSPGLIADLSGGSSPRANLACPRQG